MYTKEIVPDEDQRPPLLATVLYSVLYALLWLRHRARNAYFYLQHTFQRSFISLFKSPISYHRTTPLQNHIAFSGHIASHLEHLSQLIVFVAHHGTRHVTVYDHLQQINPTQLAHSIHQKGLHAFQLSQIGLRRTHTTYSTCKQQQPANQCQHIEQIRTTEPEICVTIVDPGAGRASIARSAKMLAERQTATSPEVDEQYVTEWLDEDEAQCMLPSEPDTLVVFPSPAGRPIPVLNGFPVWQLRLTQIRFSSKPVTDCSTHQLLQMIHSAANAPKRFGR